ncbi:S-methyl-5'-thioadenosine phosphorylase [Choiromyces venosus 120613-1]|uniref:S-methyl-5'-thioadenosine phosphorylase n=1 Tax=Choiromyces venosus 120613-1 TaxID=1336337 RepID=A0A3N4JUA4_9PEZI|nr:S-methyl-5'-thioadenosine phosphorylase [Choiromyces venosus 120613-1]
MLLPSTFSEPVRLAVIGGTGISALEAEGLTAVARLNIETPYGTPSSPLIILKTPQDTPIAFLSRHGHHHELTPTEVPNRANIAALRSIGVRSIIAFSAVGSLQERIRPRDFVIPSQIIDRTKGIRASTFFEGGLVGHVGFADPFDAGLAKVVFDVGSDGVLNGEGVKMHKDGLLICMEGPQFSTRAESNLYRSWGGDVINMSALPEAKLAKEAEMAYVMVCMSTDYDCWKTDEAAVTVETVMGNMHANGANAKHLAAAILKELAKEEHKDLVSAKHLEGSSKWACCTAPVGRSAEAVKRMEFMLPGYFS